jgi:hypothetical protein
MNLLNEPKPETFQYGFLTSKTARILSDYSPGEVLDGERIRLLSQANNFVEQILNGEALVSGDKDNLAPSMEALEVFHYGVGALSVMERMQLTARLENRSGMRDFFSEIRSTLSALQSGSPNGSASPERIKIAAKFFDVIADALLNEALECSHPDFAPTV